VAPRYPLQVLALPIAIGITVGFSLLSLADACTQFIMCKKISVTKKGANTDMYWRNDYDFTDLKLAYI
jgi:hypothetical protein